MRTQSLAIILLTGSDLHRQIQEILKGLPDQLRYYAHGTTPKKSTGKMLFGQACLMLEFLSNTFLIDRVAIARGFANGQRLVETAMEMMEIVIMLWTKRDQLMAFTFSFDWIVGQDLLSGIWILLT
jgi:hypothetical protein